MFVWRGPVQGVKWPKHPQPSHDLAVELWGTTKRSRLSRLIPRDATLTFKEFVQPIDVPLWTVCGPELDVHSTSEDSIAFFSELAASRWAVMSSLEFPTPPSATQTSSSSGSSFPTVDHLIIYAVKDDCDPKWRISARPLVLAYTDGPPTLTFTPSLSGLDSRPPTPDVIGSGDRHAQREAVNRVDTKSLQQVVLAALRLRGVRSDDPSFKQLYYLCFRGAEYALRRYQGPTGPPIELEKIREKVEALLNVLEC